ncbi:DUF6247 family protein [Actinomadura mexicana]|uniref:DUF6247 family protein n=1 Tax=Actinomadura mexicana TaxID=134959 RepID=UPI003CCC1F5F
MSGRSERTPGESRPRVRHTGKSDIMTALPEEPAASRDPGEDPAAIFDALPPSHRDQFRAEYDEAHDAAHDLARFKQVQTFRFSVLSLHRCPSRTTAEPRNWPRSCGGSAAGSMTSRSG